MDTTFETTAIDASIPVKDETLAFWNPTAAALYSLLFTPALGAWLIMRNWQRLGKPDKARQALCWCIGVLAISLGDIIVSATATIQGREAGLPFWAPVVVFIAWAVFSAYPQIKYMDDRLGETYARRSWAAPVLTALAIIIGVALAAAAAVGYAASAAASGA